MNNYIKINQNRWNNVKYDYTKTVTHFDLEEVCFYLTEYKIC